MRRILLLMLCVQIICLHAQAAQEKEITLFEYGKPLISCETNFENLFANVHVFVDDSMAPVDMLSYRYIGDVRNSRQVSRMQKRNFKRFPPIIWSSTLSHEKESVMFYPDSTGVNYMGCLFDVKEAIKTISHEYVKPGFRIYLLRYVINLVTYEQYVFVDPETKKVVTAGNFWGTGIKVSDIEKTTNVIRKN